METTGQSEVGVWGKQPHVAVSCKGFRSVQLPVEPTGKVTGDTMETTGQGRVMFGGEPSHAALQRNGYQSVPLPVPPTSKVTGDRMEAAGGGSGGSTESNNRITGTSL